MKIEAGGRGGHVSCSWGHFFVLSLSASACLPPAARWLLAVFLIYILINLNRTSSDSNLALFFFRIVLLLSKHDAKFPLPPKPTEGSPLSEKK